MPFPTRLPDPNHSLSLYEQYFQVEERNPILSGLSTIIRTDQKCS